MGSQGSPVKSYDYLLKFLLVGDSDVGKGEILDSLQDGSAESPYAYSSGESRPVTADLQVLCVLMLHSDVRYSPISDIPIRFNPSFPILMISTNTDHI